MKLFDMWKANKAQAEKETVFEPPVGDNETAETEAEVVMDADAEAAEAQAETDADTGTAVLKNPEHAAAEGEAQAGNHPAAIASEAGDGDVRIADERYEALRSELAAAREEMRRRELEYFALTLLAEEKMSPKLCTMVHGDTEDEISRNVDAVRTAVREEIQRLRKNSDNTPPTAGKAAVSATAIKKLSLRELKNIMG